MHGASTQLVKIEQACAETADRVGSRVCCDWNVRCILEFLSPVKCTA